MARTKISSPALPRYSKAPHKASIINSGRAAAHLVGQQTRKAVARGYWANLAHTLGGSLNDEYMSAVESLFSLLSLPPSDLIAVSSKITALIELAHNALVNAGIQTYEFSYCPPALVPYKVAYFRLLRLLRDRRNDVHSHLQGKDLLSTSILDFFADRFLLCIPWAIADRVQRLLLPLSPSFQVQTGAGPSHGSSTCSVSPGGPLKTANLDHASSSLGAPACTTNNLTAQLPRMPPPPVNWRDAHIQATSQQPSAWRRSTQLWTHDEALRALAHLNRRTDNGDADPSPVKRRRTSSTTNNSGFRVIALAPEGDQENATPNPPASEDTAEELPRVIRPPPRRFGIFCTGKSSMHGPNPRAWRHRPIAVRPVE